MASVVELGVDFGYADSLLNEGCAFEMAGDTLKAFLKYREAVEINPRNVLLLISLASACMSLRDFRQAKVWLLQAAHCDPKSAFVHFSLGCVLEYLNRPIEAENHYKRAIKLDPSDSDPVYNLAWLLERLGRYFESIGYWRKCAHLEGGSPAGIVAQRSVHNLAKMFLVG